MRAETALELMHYRLNAVDVPQHEFIDPERFEFQLRTIFFETLSSIDRDDLDTLKRSDPIFLSPTSSHVDSFARKLNSTQSEKIKQLPNQLFQHYIHTMPELSMAHLFQNPSRFVEKTAHFLLANFKRSPDPQQTFSDLNIEQHNKYVLKYWLLSLNFGLVDNLIYGLFFQYRQSTSLLYFLYSFCMAILGILLVVAALLIIGVTALTQLLISRLNSIVYSLVRTLRNGIERPLLNLITFDQYERDVEKAACMKLGKQYREEDDKFVLLDTETDVQISEAEIYNLGLRVLQAKASQLMQIEGGTQSSLNSIKLQISKDITQNRGINHFRFATQSIYSNLTQSIPAEHNPIVIWMLRLMRFAAAIPTVFGLSTPLVLLDLASRAIDLLCISVGVMVMLSCMAILILLNVLNGLPLYLYDSCFAVQNQSFWPAAEEKSKIMDSFCHDMVSSFFYKSSFVQNKFKQLLQNIDADTSIPKNH